MTTTQPRTDAQRAIASYMEFALAEEMRELRETALRVFADTALRRDIEHIASGYESLPEGAERDAAVGVAFHEARALSESRRWGGSTL